MIQNRNSNGRINKQYDDMYMETLVKEYADKRNTKTISAREGIPIQTLYYYIRKFGEQKPNRKHLVDEEFFETINSQDKAYILGFIMADGCISKSSDSNPRPNRIAINISYKDRVVLEFCKEKMKCDYNIDDYIPDESTFGNEMMSKLIINSIKICDDLYKYGVTIRKTGSEILPILQQNLYRHFLRGFLDGDGYITSSGSSTTIGFCSNKNMLNQIKRFLYITLDLKSKASISPDSRGKKLFYLEYSVKEDIVKLKKYLYYKANFYLERKFIKLTQ